MLGQPLFMLRPKSSAMNWPQLPLGTTATDLVLTVTQLLRQHGVVNKFVEFYGPGVSNMGSRTGDHREHGPGVRRHDGLLSGRRGDDPLSRADRARLGQCQRTERYYIMLRDVLKIAPLAETTAEISALADVLIEAALNEATSQLQRRYGASQYPDTSSHLDTPFAILALGKLGGNELNYSSDVDLMFVYGDAEDSPAAPVSNREYFVRLVQHITEILSRVTREGPVFRIDLRLRPQGGEGELAIRLSRALSYYSETAHDWERQALIKIRHCAGDATLAREFIRAVQPHVYTERVNFAAIKTALVAREKMHKHRQGSVSAQTETIDVKIDRGGIRDIEFLVQCLQRVYGGAEPWLRSGGTLFSLQKLHDKGHISGREFHDLTSAYDFLRHLEHRLQLREGRQTHRLPVSEIDCLILQRAMESYSPGENRSRENPGGDLATVVRRRMGAVTEIYQRIIFQQQSRGQRQMRDAEFKLLNVPERAAPTSPLSTCSND